MSCDRVYTAYSKSYLKLLVLVATLGCVTHTLGDRDQSFQEEPVTVPKPSRSAATAKRNTSSMVISAVARHSMLERSYPVPLPIPVPVLLMPLGHLACITKITSKLLTAGGKGALAGAKWFIDDPKYFNIKVLKFTLKVSAFVVAVTVGGPVPAVLGMTALTIGTITEIHKRYTDPTKDNSKTNVAGFLAFTIVKETALHFIGLDWTEAFPEDAAAAITNRVAVIVGDTCAWLKLQAGNLCGGGKKDIEDIILEVAKDADVSGFDPSVVEPFKRNDVQDAKAEAAAVKKMNSKDKTAYQAAATALKQAAATALDEGKKYFKCK